MQLRFWRRFRVAPLTTINVSKGGLSMSFGRRGLHLTLGRSGARVTAGLPGTGLSVTAYKKYAESGVGKKRSSRSDVTDLVRRSTRKKLSPAELPDPPDDPARR